MGDVLFILLIIAVIPVFGLTIFIQKYLKKHHPLEWEEIGSPSVFLNNSIQNNHQFSKFVKQQMSGGIEDSFLTKLCKAHYFYKRIFYVIFWVLVVLFISNR